MHDINQFSVHFQADSAFAGYSLPNVVIFTEAQQPTGYWDHPVACVFGIGQMQEFRPNQLLTDLTLIKKC